MKIVLHGENDLSLSEFDSPGMEIEQEAHVHYSAMEMFATSFAWCTASVVISYGGAAGIPLDNLAVRMRWEYVEDPYRIGRISMEITWPGLTENRVKAAQHAAGHCTLHKTLGYPPQVETIVHQ